MPYRIPTFNLVCNLKAPPVPGVPGIPIPPARVIDLPCQLTFGRRVNVASTGGTAIPGRPTQLTSLLVPKGADVRGPQDTISFDMVEVPSGSGRWYQVCYVDDIGRGFANEHRTAGLLALAGSWTAPYL